MCLKPLEISHTHFELTKLEGKYSKEQKDGASCND